MRLLFYSGVLAALASVKHAIATDADAEQLLTQRLLLDSGATTDSFYHSLA